MCIGGCLMEISLKDVIEKLNNNSTKVVAKDIGVPEKKLRMILKEHDFFWDNSKKSWVYRGSNMDELLTLSSSDIGVTSNSQRRNKKVTNVLDYIEKNVTITDIEKVIAIIKSERSSDDASYDLMNRVSEIDKTVKRTRKAYAISDVLQDRMDKFSITHRITKKEIIELALYDFFEKYND